jgi:hypothetical protein
MEFVVSDDFGKSLAKYFFVEFQATAPLVFYAISKIYPDHKPQAATASR